MATCRDCLHFKACEAMMREVGCPFTGYGADVEKRCDSFLDRSTLVMPDAKTMKFKRWSFTVEPQTNADRIRAMSDEELAEFLILSPEMEFDVCGFCEYGNQTPMDDRGFCLHPYGACLANAKAEAFKKWLKQPARGGDNDG